MRGHVDDDGGTPRRGTRNRDVINSVETEFNIHIVEKIWLLTDTLGFASKRFPMVDRPPIGQVIRAARLHLGHTQAKFALLCNITPQYLSLLELGEVNVSLDTLLMISEALGEPLSSLLAKAEAMAASVEVAQSHGSVRTGKQTVTVPKQVEKKGATSQKSQKDDSPAVAAKPSGRVTAPRSDRHRVATNPALPIGQPIVASGSAKTKRVTTNPDVPRNRKTKAQ